MPREAAKGYFCTVVAHHLIAIPVLLISGCIIGKLAFRSLEAKCHGNYNCNFYCDKHNSCGETCTDATLQDGTILNKILDNGFNFSNATRCWVFLPGADITDPSIAWDLWKKIALPIHFGLNMIYWINLAFIDFQGFIDANLIMSLVIACISIVSLALGSLSIALLTPSTATRTCTQYGWSGGGTSDRITWGVKYVNHYKEIGHSEKWADWIQYISPMPDLPVECYIEDSGTGMIANFISIKDRYVWLGIICSIGLCLSVALTFPYLIDKFVKSGCYASCKLCISNARTQMNCCSCVRNRGCVKYLKDKYDKLRCRCCCTFEEPTHANKSDQLSISIDQAPGAFTIRSILPTPSAPPPEYCNERKHSERPPPYNEASPESYHVTFHYPVDQGLQYV